MKVKVLLFFRYCFEEKRLPTICCCYCFEEKRLPSFPCPKIMLTAASLHCAVWTEVLISKNSRWDSGWGFGWPKLASSHVAQPDSGWRFGWPKLASSHMAQRDSGWGFGWPKLVSSHMAQPILGEGFKRFKRMLIYYDRHTICKFLE